MRHWLSLGTWMKCINYTLCTSFILFFGGKKQRLLIAQSTRSVILCALYIVYIIRYWHLSGHLTLHAAQCKHFKCQFMQLFCPAIDENQFAQAAKRKWNGKAERQKNKSRTRQDTNNNKLAACDTEERTGEWGREDTGKLSLKPGCRHTVAIISIANRHISISMPDSGEEIQISAKRDTRQATSEMLNQIKVPATKCKIRQRTRNSNSCWNCRGRKGGGEEVL